MSELDVLRTLGDQLAPPSLDVLRETARRRDRRARIVSVTASAAVVAAVTATAVVLSPDGGREPRPSEPPTNQGSTTHPLTYADGTTIHYGDQTIDADGPVAELDLTDQGVAFRTEDGRIWFSDGSSVDEIGAVGEPGPGYGDNAWPILTRPGWMLSANVGSQLVWFEFPAPGEPEVVVYDTGTQQEVARDTVNPGHVSLPATVTDHYVYWYLDPEPDVFVDEVEMARFDPATSEQSAVSPEDVRDDLAADAAVRSVLTNEGSGCGAGPCRPLRYYDGMNQQMVLSEEGVYPAGAGDQVWEDVTGQPFRFEPMSGYPRNEVTWLVQWLDDETVVILNPRPQRTDLIECHLDTDSCEVVVSGPTTIVVPEFGMGVYYG